MFKNIINLLECSYFRWKIICRKGKWKSEEDQNSHFIFNLMSIMLNKDLTANPTPGLNLQHPGSQMRRLSQKQIKTVILVIGLVLCTISLGYACVHIAMMIESNFYSASTIHFSQNFKQTSRNARVIEDY